MIQIYERAKSSAGNLPAAVGCGPACAHITNKFLISYKGIDTFFSAFYPQNPSVKEF